MSKDSNELHVEKLKKYYEHASAQIISCPWSLPEESIREEASDSKINLRGLGLKE